MSMSKYLWHLVASPNWRGAHLCGRGRERAIDQWFDACERILIGAPEVMGEDVIVIDKIEDEDE